jgi:protein-S-isoprenylcysteine O-methyltransferase Ste14
MKMKAYINIFKGLTALFVLLMMAYFQAWQNQTAWVYLGLHGSYGILWVLKSRFFPDKSWERSIHWLVGLGIWLALAFYLIAPWLLISRFIQHAGWFLAFCIFMFVLGVFLHIASDMQKFTALRIKPERLIQDGLFKRLRNPNYFGELLIYGSFALLSWHWIPFLVLAAYLGSYWIPKMLRKDRSLSRYPGFDEYKRKSKLFIPYLL